MAQRPTRRYIKARRWPAAIPLLRRPFLLAVDLIDVIERSRGASPRPVYLQLKERVGQNRAVLSVARNLLRRAHHTLRELGDDALLPDA